MKLRRYVDDHGNTPKQRAKHVCTRHGKAYCAKPKCIKQIKKRVNK